MKYEKGFTLVEVLVTIVILGICLPLVINVFSTTLTTQKVVFDENSVQIEARRVMENITIRMRDNARWTQVNTNTYHLRQGETVSIIYEAVDSLGQIRTTGTNGRILSDSVSFFQVTDLDPKKTKVIVEITKQGSTIRLESTIHYSRFGVN